MWKQMESWKNAERRTVKRLREETKKKCSIDQLLLFCFLGLLVDQRNQKKHWYLQSSMVELCIPKFTPNHLGDTVFSLKNEGYLTSGVDIHLNKKMRLSRESLPVVGVELRYRKLCWKPLNTPRYICILSNGFKFHHRTYVFPQKKRPFPNLKKLLPNSLRIIVVSHLFCGGRIF